MTSPDTHVIPNKLQAHIHSYYLTLTLHYLNVCMCGFYQSVCMDECLNEVRDSRLMVLGQKLQVNLFEAGFLPDSRRSQLVQLVSFLSLRETKKKGLKVCQTNRNIEF